MDEKRFTLSKNELLSSKVLTEHLFKKNLVVKKYPLFFIYNSEIEFSKFDIQLMFTVPKKRIKSAVSRNRIKRLIKESYRINQFEFKDLMKKPSIGAFIFVGNEKVDYKTINESVVNILKSFTKE